MGIEGLQAISSKEVGVKIPIYRVGSDTTEWTYQPDKPSRRELKALRQSRMQVWRAMVEETAIVGPNGKTAWSFREVLAECGSALGPNCWERLV